VKVKGYAEPEAILTLNDTVVVASSQGSFEVWASLADGENVLTLVATDEAANSTTVTRTVYKVEPQPVTASVFKTVAPTGQVNYGDLLTYTLVVSATPDAQITLYDPLTDTTFIRFVEHPSSVIHDGGVITGPLTVTPTNQVAVSFIARVDVPDTAGLTVDVTNRACVYLFGGTLGDRVCSDVVTNEAFRPYDVYLPAVLRRD
jgi:hypothetical protein